MLGLKHGTNLLVDFDPGWRTAFEEESARIQSALFDVVLGIEHYGSTAVEGLRAKPIIDILVGVAPLEGMGEMQGAVRAARLRLCRECRRPRTLHLWARA